MTERRSDNLAARIRWAAGLFLALGLAIRLTGVFCSENRLFKQFPTEDGYLSLTIARNIALGHGMSTSDGTIATNGTQPLVTLIWSGVFWLVDGDRAAAVRSILGLQTIFSLLTVLLIVKLGQQIEPQTQLGKALSWLAGGLWLASPVFLGHTMNCLETGLYELAVLTVLLVFMRQSTRGPWGWRSVVTLGFTLGVAFLVRNDAVFLCVAVLATHCLSANGAPLLRRVLEAAGAGIVALVLALPWLAYNLTFGSIVPISGQAESLDQPFAGNLPGLPAILTEYFGLAVLIPQSFEQRWWVIVPCTLFVAGCALVFTLFLRRSESPALRRGMFCVAGFVGMLAAYYGLFFGAGWFLSRYLFPLSAFTTLLWVHVASWGLGSSRPRLGRGLLAGGLGAALLLSIGFGYRTVSHGLEHPHFQVVDWVSANVAPTQWVGAVQTGTLGFFHDRTINLDGKVNPAALAAGRAERLPAYVVETGVDFLIDWHGIERWKENPPLRDYEVLVDDESKNLGVLRRPGASTLKEREHGVAPGRVDAN